MAAAYAEPPPTDRRPEGRFEWERIVRRIVMPERAKLVAFVLSSYADRDGTRVRPGVDVLAAVTGQGVATVKRLLRVLRDDYGLLEQTRRGGGRGGHGRTTEYRLTVPVDLLDRFEMLGPGDRPARLADLYVIPQSEGSPVDNSDSELSQVIPQSASTPVDNSTMEDPPGDPSIVVGNDFHGSETSPESRLRDQNERLRDHPGDPLPPTRPTTQDHPTTPDPAQPPTAHTDTSQNDHVDGGGSRAEPARCEHNFVRRVRRDGKPACALCRRAQEST